MVIFSATPLSTSELATSPRVKVTSLPDTAGLVGALQAAAKLPRLVVRCGEAVIDWQSFRTRPAGKVSTTWAPGRVPSGTVTTSSYVTTSPMVTSGVVVEVSLVVRTALVGVASAVVTVAASVSGESVGRCGDAEGAFL